MEYLVKVVLKLNLILFLFLFPIILFSMEQKETYYGYNPNHYGRLYIVGFENETRFEVFPLSKGKDVNGENVELENVEVEIKGVLNRMDRMEIPLQRIRHFKIETNKPMLVILGFDGPVGNPGGYNFWGSFFYPTSDDGKKSYGRNFIINPMALDNLHPQSQMAKTVFFTRDESKITVKNKNGDVVDESELLPPESFWLPTKISRHGLYQVESTGVISIANNSGNGLTNVPPIPGGRTTEDCNNDLGKKFFFATHGWEQGAVGVFNPTLKRLSSP